VDRSRRILEALGAAGVERVVRDAFDRAGLVHAANACRVSHPGKRNQSIPTPALVADLIRKATEDSDSALALIKALDKSCAREIRRVASLGIEDLRDPAATADVPARPGRLLYALAADGRDEAASAAAALLARLTSLTESPQAADPREAGSPQARLHALEAARDELQSEIAGLRAGAESAAADLLTARKHAHALETKLNRATEENTQLHERNLVLSGRLEELERGDRHAPGTAEPSPELKRTLRESQKLLHEIREAADARLTAGAEAARPYLEALASTLRAVQSEIAELRQEREADRRKERDAIADLAREFHSVKADLADQKAATERPARKKGEPARVGLFVDVQNMYYAARQLNARLDFGALIEEVSRDRRMIRAIAYVVQNRDIDQSGFLAMLQQRSYEVRRKDLKVRADGSSKGDWDMGMALEILSLVDSLDVVVLVSGDGDFVPLVNAVKTRGPRVEVYSFPGSTAKELVEACDRHVAIDESLLLRVNSIA